MNVLLIGSGGREHARAWKIAQSPRLDRLLSVPGNPGTGRHGQNVPFPLSDFEALVDLAQREQIDLAVNTSQPPLGGGLVGPARPAFSFRDSDFWAQGVSFGVEFRY